MAALDFVSQRRSEALSSPPIATSEAAPLLRLEGAIGAGEPVSYQFVAQFLARADIGLGVRLEINSHGGDSDEAIRIYNTIRSLPVPTWAHVEHTCYSAAVLIYAAAAYRTAGLGAEFILHASRIERDSLPAGYLTARDFQQYAAMLQKLDAEMASILALRTGYPDFWFAEQMENEDPAAAHELLDCGLVHEIPSMTLPATSEFLAAIPHLRGQRVFIDSRYDTANFRAAAAAADWFRVDG